MIVRCVRVDVIEYDIGCVYVSVIKEAKDGMSSRLVFLTICNDDHLIGVLMIPTQNYHSKVVAKVAVSRSLSIV